jgi:tetratricopeptide (TPR) repeat protein
MSARTERAALLLNQSRYELAEQELKQALAEDPDEPLAHSLLARALIGRKEYAAATEAAERAVAAGPDLPFTHYALALTRYHRNHYPEAEAAIGEAIRLDPSDADYYSLLAAVFAEQEKWSSALVVAEEGLALDPEHGTCGNVRAMALVRLGRQDEAAAAMEGALARDPDDAFTHANRGWSLLHERDPRRALEHFQEALRLDPELDFARAGMIEALKARYWLYRQILGYFLWIARLSPGARWAVVIGLLVLQQVVASVARTSPELKPFLQPVLIGYLIFALTTWTAMPLTNLLLRLNRFGRLALSPDERLASNWIGGFVGAGLIGVVYGMVAPSPYDWPGWLGALSCVILLLPLSATFGCEPGWPRRVMAFYTLVMFVIAVVGLTLFTSGFVLAERDPFAAIENVKTGAGLLRFNGLAALLSGFVANWLVNIRPRQ